MTAFLRAFSLAFLAWHFGRLFPGLAEPWVVAAAVLAGLAGGAAARSVRGALVAPAALVLAWLVPAGASAAATFLAGASPSVVDTLPLWIDRQEVFAAAAFLVGAFSGWAFTGRTERRGLERLVNAGVLAAVFWSQGPYHITLYSHPLILALVLGLFLVSELLLLAGSRPARVSWAATFLVVVAGAALLWSLLGQFEDQATSAGGGLMKPDLFQFDFAPLVRLEEEISLGENLVLLYREEGPPRQRFLRRLVLDRWDPTQGFGLSSPQVPTVGRRDRTLAPEGGSEGRVEVDQEYYLVNLDPSSLLALNEPVRVTPLARWDGSSFVNAYRVKSLTAGFDTWEYEDWKPPQGPPQPGGNDPELKALARQITAGLTTPYAQAAAIEAYLQENYFYSLKPGTPGSRGALKHFLFEGKKGYCSYFAFAMTLLLRSLDVPARVAVGFLTDPSATVLGFTPVRAYQAHAWVEVPLGPWGWVEFDPTSQTPAPGEPFRFPQAQDPDQLKAMISEILKAQPEPVAEKDQAEAAEPRNLWAALWQNGAPALPWLFLAAAVLANEFWRHRWNLLRVFSRDDRRRARIEGRQGAWAARRAGLPLRPGETPEAWSRREGGAAAPAWADLVSRARYGAVWPAESARTLRTATRSLVRDLDLRRPAFHRFAGTLFPWWPR